MSEHLPIIGLMDCSNSVKWPGDLPGSHKVAARFAVLVVASALRAVKATGVPTFTITWDQAQQRACEAGYVDNGFGYLPMGWFEGGRTACLSKANTFQRRPPVHVGLAMKAFAAAHEDCAGLELLPLDLKWAWQATARTLWG